MLFHKGLKQYIKLQHTTRHAHLTLGVLIKSDTYHAPIKNFVASLHSGVCAVEYPP